MNRLLTKYSLHRQNEEFGGSGGVSQDNRVLGFVPAFLDTDTGAIYRSCFRDGRPAQCHLLEGLPVAVSVRQDSTGCTTAVKSSVIAGFVRNGRFYTREEAARTTGRAARRRVRRPANGARSTTAL